MRAKPKLFFGWYIFCHPSLLMCDPHTLVEPGIAGPARVPLSLLGFHGRMVTSHAFSSGLGGLAEWLAVSTEHSCLAGKGEGKWECAGGPASGRELLMSHPEPQGPACPSEEQAGPQPKTQFLP